MFLSALVTCFCYVHPHALRVVCPACTHCFTCCCLHVCCCRLRGRRQNQTVSIELDTFDGTHHRRRRPPLHYLSVITVNVHSTIDSVTDLKNRKPEHGPVMVDESSSTQKKKFAQTNAQARLLHVSLVVTKFESSGTSKDVLRIDCTSDKKPWGTYHHSLHHKTSVARLLKAHKLQVSTSVGKRGAGKGLPHELLAQAWLTFVNTEQYPSPHPHYSRSRHSNRVISSAPTQPTEMNNRTCSERMPKNRWIVITIASWKPPWPAWRKTNIRTDNSPQNQFSVTCGIFGM